MIAEAGVEVTERQRELLRWIMAETKESKTHRVRRPTIKRIQGHFHFSDGIIGGGTTVWRWVSELKAIGMICEPYRVWGSTITLTPLGEMYAQRARPTEPPEQKSTAFERVSSYLSDHGPASKGDIEESLGLKRCTLDALIYRTHRDRFKKDGSSPVRYGLAVA